MPNLPNFKTWPDELVNLRPSGLKEIYDKGYQGAVKDEEADEELHSHMEWKEFGDAAFEFGLVGSGDGKASCPFMSTLKFAPDAYEVAQRRGDCVSFSTRNASDLSRAVEIDIRGERETFTTVSATEPIYWWRGHSGEGASCSRLADAVSTKGGLMLRKDYPDLGLDLTEYNSKLGHDGRRGPPPDVVTEQRKHPVGSVSRIRGPDEAADALANGYGLSVCSSYGFSSRRDEEGISRPKGSWAHAMAWIAVDARPDTIRKHRGRLFLVQNSWGRNWNSGPKRLNQPDGSFWITEQVARGMINSGGALVLSDVDGWRRRELPDFSVW